MINFPCPQCQKQLTFADDMGGTQGLCPSCTSLIDIPLIDDDVTGVKVSKGSFSSGLMDFVKTKVSDIDDDTTDNHFLVARETTSTHSDTLKNFIKTKVSDIDDDTTDNHFLDTKPQVKGTFSASLQNFIKGSKDSKKKAEEEDQG